MQTVATSLTYEQKKELRKLYGNYKDCRLSDYENNEEYRADKMYVWEEVLSKLKEFGINENVDIEKSIYSKKQLQFIEDAKNADGELRYSYSGRGMFGDYCPALYCDSHNDITTEIHTCIDSMGKSIVIYVP